MQIQAINNYSTPQNLQFKKAYPVVHWLAETNASYSPQIELKVAQEFNENIIRRLNMKQSVIREDISELINKIAELSEKIKN